LFFVPKFFFPDINVNVQDAQNDFLGWLPTVEAMVRAACLLQF
jgi:hypothetical protein